MSNINKTSDDIRKKLSIQDYNTPSKPLDVKDTDVTKTVDNKTTLELLDIKTQKQTDATSPELQNKNTAMPQAANSTDQHLVNTESIQLVNSSVRHSDMTTNNQVVMTQKHESVVTKKQSNVETQKQNAGKMVKVTHYLTLEENQLFTEVFIKRLRTYQKVTKSSVIASAITLLYEKEFLK